MDFRYKPAIRIISLVTLLFFCWTFAGGIDIAYAIKSDQQSAISNQQNSQKSSGSNQKSKTQKSEEKFQKTIEDIEKTLTDTTSDTDTKKNKLKTKKSEIDGLDTAIKKQFSDTERLLKEKGLPPEILERHYKFVKHYEDNLKELNDNLAAIDKSKTKSDADAAIGRAKSHLEKVKPPKKHIPLDPNKLPFATPEVKTFEKIERQSIEEPKTPDLSKKNASLGKDKAPILIASAGSLDGLLAQASDGTTISRNAPPTEDDLAETLEVQFTEELREIAALLENNPIYLYEFVRNNYLYEPYYGSIKGSQSTLLLQGGNDFDQASLLIALLRVSGIPARYVYGTVEIPIEKLMSWVGGVTNPNTAAQIMATNGIPGKLITEGGQIKYAQIKHVWIEAFLPYSNYRGILNDPAASKTWIPLDPSFKLYEINPAAIDMAELQNFDIDNYMTTYLQSITSTTPAEEYLTNTKNYVSNNLPDKSFYNLLLSTSIIDKILDLLPNSLPYSVNEVGTRFSTIPDTYRHTIAMELTDSNFNETILSYTASWSNLLHKRFTLSYVPATALDEQTISTYGGLYSTPPYLIYVKPLLKVEGETVAEGGAVKMANNHFCKIKFIRPNGVVADIVTNNLTIGATLAIGLGAGYTTGRIITYRASKLENAVDAEQLGEPILGEYLNLLALNYLQELDSSRKMISETMKILDTNRMAELVVGVDIGVSYLFDMPLSASIRGLFVDADYNLSTPMDIAGDRAKTRRFQILAGMTSSALEHKIFESIEDTEAISAIKALQIAYVQGIPIHKVDANNIFTELPTLQLSNEVKTDIQNVVHTGKEVIVSERNIQLNDWKGVGYIVLDPVTGAGAYMISGLSGGYLTVVTQDLKNRIERGEMTKEGAKEYILKHQKQIWFLQPVDGPITSKFGKRGSGFHKGVDIAVGNWTPVRAVAIGKITQIYNEPDGYGKVVYIDHGAGVETRYAHNCEILVKVEDEVIDGQIIAKSGNTGYVVSGKKPLPPDYPRCLKDDHKGAHVHFEIRLNGEAVNPEDFDMK